MFFPVIHHRLFSRPGWVRHRGGKEKDNTTHQGGKKEKLVSTLFLLHFPLTSIFHELMCFVELLLQQPPPPPATPTVLNSSGSNTSAVCTQPINHWGAWQTNHLLMRWGGHEFLTAFVLFIKPDQTMRIQTSLKGDGGSRRE